jgi:RNA polymerase sigma-70 factor (ECF subfamily)
LVLTPLGDHGPCHESQKNLLTNEPIGGNWGITGIVNTPNDDESQLIDRAQAGDAIAFQRLVEQYAARMWRCALALCRDRHWAEDLAQETLIEAWRSLPRFDGRCQFSTWLYGILRHRFLKGRRRQNAAQRAVPDDLGQVPGPACRPDRSAESSEDARQIRRAVASLPEKHRLVIELRFFAGVTLGEIAAAVGCPLGTVKSRLHHALEKLRQMDLAVNLFAPCREPKGSKP